MIETQFRLGEKRRAGASAAFRAFQEGEFARRDVAWRSARQARRGTLRHIDIFPELAGSRAVERNLKNICTTLSSNNEGGPSRSLLEKIA
ncbi:hypothetical protein [Methylosinus sp. C49]|uniref:hypothetical protein n=1 Tax=Methylosinus sp. C49 TaxID=2699395 RepID=UPI001379891A|nr:hypothetical protein [Methylosinus sp. C49]